MKEKLMKDNYKVESLLIKNMDRIMISLSEYSHYEVAKYAIEDQLTENEKLEIFNSHKDGLGDYLLEKIKLYQEAKNNGTIKRSKYDSLNRNSLSKWLKENDPRKILRLSYKYHFITYWMGGTEFRMQDTTPHTIEISSRMLWTDTSIINQWFHILLQELEQEEIKYYKENNPDQINYTKLKTLVDRYSNLLDYDTYKDLYETVNNRNEFDSMKIKKYLGLMTRLDQKIQGDIKSVLTQMTIHE